MDDAIEAGLLVVARSRIDALITDAHEEATGDLAEGHTRWKTLVLELWGRDHEGDNNQANIGDGVPLPPPFAPRVLRAIKAEIEARLGELGVEVDVVAKP